MSCLKRTAATLILIVALPGTLLAGGFQTLE